MAGTRIITVACAKGGTAKTTTSMMLACSLCRRGLQAVVLDADNTGGATKWAGAVDDMRMDDPHAPVLPFDVVPVNQAVLDRRRLETRWAGMWIVIDTPPSDTGMIQKAMDVADVVVIPTQPGEADLRLAGETYAACRHGVVLLTRVRANTRSLRRAVDDLDSAHVTRFDTMVPERESIRGAYGRVTVDAWYAGVAGELVDFVNGLEAR